MELFGLWCLLMLLGPVCLMFNIFVYQLPVCNVKFCVLEGGGGGGVGGGRD